MSHCEQCEHLSKIRKIIFYHWGQNVETRVCQSCSDTIKDNYYDVVGGWPVSKPKQENTE